MTRTVEQIQTELQELDAEIADHDSGQRPLDATNFGIVWNRRQECMSELRRAEKQANWERRRANA